MTAVSPVLLSSSILPPYLLHGALISAINKLAHLINCCYVSSFYCIMRNYQTTWRKVPEKSSHHCGNLVSHFNIIAYGQLCLVKQSCFQNVSYSVVLLPGYPSTATCAVHSFEIRGFHSCDVIGCSLECDAVSVGEWHWTV